MARTCIEAQEPSSSGGPKVSSRNSDVNENEKGEDWRSQVGEPTDPNFFVDFAEFKKYFYKDKVKKYIEEKNMKG